MMFVTADDSARADDKRGASDFSEPMEQKGKWLREEVATVAVVGRGGGAGGHGSD